MNLQEIIKLEFHEPLRQLAKLYPWFTMRTGNEPGDPRPRTWVDIHWAKLANAGLPSLLINRLRHANPLEPVYFDALALALRDGPKLFVPSAEQFEAMTHTECRLPVGDFRSPYPVLFIRIPHAAGAAIAKKVGLEPNNIPRYITVRTRREPGDHGRSVLATMRMGNGYETHQQFTDQPGNPDMETALTRRVYHEGEEGNPLVEADLSFGEECSRAALNLCLLLTHYGHRPGGPVDPAAYAKHRAKKHLEHLAHGDFQTVEMTQNIRVRDLAVELSVPGPGGAMPYELKPHWRKGHWRALRGHGAARAAGATVPLCFVRPCLVRADRASGDLGDSRVTYVA